MLINKLFLWEQFHKNIEAENPLKIRKTYKQIEAQIIPSMIYLKDIYNVI